MNSISGEKLSTLLRPRIRNRLILDAMQRVPREEFLDSSMLPYAGDDSALPIGHEQTTSAPGVIARMLEMMLSDKKPPLKILEIGSGCGYQTALLVEMGCEVFSIERVRPLADAARRRLKKMGYNAAQITHGDGFLGDTTNAPFDGIVICAECADVPPQLPPQLAEDARLVLPLRRRDSTVRLAAVNPGGTVTSVRDAVRFVSMLQGVT